MTLSPGHRWPGLCAVTHPACMVPPHTIAQLPALPAQWEGIEELVWPGPMPKDHMLRVIEEIARLSGSSDDGMLHSRGMRSGHRATMRAVRWRSGCR